MSNLARRTDQRPRLLEPRIIEGLEKRLTMPTHPVEPAREHELRSIGKALLAHINALEESAID